MVVELNLELKYMDVMIAFLYWDLDETILHKATIRIWIRKQGRFYVSKLNKYLYDLKQIPRKWSRGFDEFITIIGFEHNKYDTCVYFKYIKNGWFIILLLYVDDILTTSNSKHVAEKLKIELNNEFKMKYLGVFRKILGIEITRQRDLKRLHLSWETYLKKSLISLG